MPRYRYSCNSCETEFFVFHSWEEIQSNCIECESVDIIKLLTRPIKMNKNKQNADKPGQITKEYIDSNKEVLEDLKKTSSSELYEPS